MMETSYPYAVGRVKALESHLINNNQWQRLWEANEVEAMKILKEIGYGVEVTDASDVERLIDYEVKKASMLINEITPEPELTDLFLLPIDGQNLKIILKGIIQRIEVKEMLQDSGSVPVELLQKAVEYQIYDDLPEAFSKALKELEGEKRPQKISAVIDNAVYRQILDNLRSTKNELLKYYFTSKIDFTNILTVIRGNTLDLDVHQCQRLLIRGGEISIHTFSEAIGMEINFIPNQLSKGYYSMKIRSILDNYVLNHSVTEVEEKLNSLSFEIIYDARNDSFGIGPLAHYLLTRIREGKILRVMFAGKRAGIKIPFSELGII